MHATVSHPGKMEVMPGHTSHGRTMVNVDEDTDNRALTLWVTPEVAAQWIEALTPLAAQSTTTQQEQP